MLHRVSHIERDGLWPVEHLKISPDFLEEFILNLISCGYKFISLDQLSDELSAGIIGEKKIIFTLDDGYKDNLYNAYPIFKKYNIPFTIYLSTSFQSKTAKLWWFALQDIILKNSHLSLDGTNYSCVGQMEKINSYFQISKIIRSISSENINNEIDHMFYKYHIDWAYYCEELALNWDDIAKLNLDPLVTIGSHTINHYPLSKLSAIEVAEEIKGCIDQIEANIGKKVIHFAYPYGSDFEIGQREIDIASGLGIRTACTTRIGNIYPKHKNHLFSLPRIMLTEESRIFDLSKIRRKRFLTI